MKASLMKGLVIAGTALTGVVAVPAFAQSGLTGETSDDNAIIVTARRIEEDVQDVPISMTVLNQEQLAARNITSSVELATYTPSLTVNKRFGPDKAAFAIRGFTQDLTTAPTVAVYFADVIAPRLISNLGGGNGAGPGSMFDLQNVQVLYGPQGTLFGRNTNGGAVLLVPRKPTDKLEGYVEGTIGNYDQRRLQAVINLPLADTFKVRGGIDWNKRDGYVKNRSGVGPKDFNDIDYFAARLSILAELTPNLENYTLFTYTEGDTHGTLGKYAFCNPGANPASAGFAAVTRADNCAAFANQANYGFYESDNSNPDPFVRTNIWQVINTTSWQASEALTV
jgi:iron complex outermembrane receptor protein